MCPMCVININISIDANMNGNSYEYLPEGGPFLFRSSTIRIGCLRFFQTLLGWEKDLNVMLKPTNVVTP